MLKNTEHHFHWHGALSLPGIGSNVLLFLSKSQILEVKRIGCWTKNRGVSLPPQIIHLVHRILNHYFHHPFWGTTIFGNTRIRKSLHPFHLKICCKKKVVKISYRPDPPSESQLRCFIGAGCLHGLLHKNGVPVERVDQKNVRAITHCLNQISLIWACLKKIGGPTNAVFLYDPE